MARTGYLITVYKDINPSSSTYNYVREERIKDDETCGEVEPQYRWVAIEGSFVCSGYDKYSIEKYQVSYDGGTTWEDTDEPTRTGSVIERNSEDCGYSPTPTPSDYSSQYFTIEAIENTSIGLVGINYKSVSSVNFTDIQYSLNDSEWSDWNTSTGYYMDLEKGDKLRLKAVNNAKTNDGLKFKSRDSSYEAHYNVYGNINSLYDGIPTMNSGYKYNSLFEGNYELADASNLVLPATTLVSSCYINMFKDCINLTAAPALPATTLAEQCYQSMFYNCESLVNAPELPATTMARQCYHYMFQDCIGLEAAPELPATILAEDCYLSMFEGCTNLVDAPELPATTLASGCYNSMFRNCTGLINAPELPATTMEQNCYSSMFYGCTSLLKAPVLSARTLTYDCYTNMFYDCESLNYIKCLATVITTDFSMHTYRWTYNVGKTGTFVKSASMSDWTTGTSGIPSGWTVVNE